MEQSSPLKSSSLNSTLDSAEEQSVPVPNPGSPSSCPSFLSSDSLDSVEVLPGNNNPVASVEPALSHQSPISTKEPRVLFGRAAKEARLRDDPFDYYQFGYYWPYPFPCPSLPSSTSSEWDSDDDPPPPKKAAKKRNHLTLRDLGLSSGSSDSEEEAVKESSEGKKHYSYRDLGLSSGSSDSEEEGKHQLCHKRKLQDNST